MNEVRVLGFFMPSAWQSEVIEAEFRQLPTLSACCRKERISVRIPQGIVPHPDNLQWHQDGGGSQGTTKHMVVWASEQPTEFLMSDGVYFYSMPGDVVWFDNTKAWHKQPTGTDETKRWFVSIRCSGAV